MPTLRRLLTLLGGAAAAVLAAVFAPMALGHAEAAGGPYETCDGAACLVTGPDNPADWTYGGFRPYFTQWEGNQPYLVQVAQGDGTQVDAGSYDIKVSDTWTPQWYSDVYKYGDFTPAAGAEGVNPGAFGDLTGTTVYNTVVGNYHNLTIDEPNGDHYWVVSTPTYTNVEVTIANEGGSQDYMIQPGEAAPTMLWDSLWNPSFVAVPNYLVPDDPWAGIDFDPGQYLTGDVVGG